MKIAIMESILTSGGHETDFDRILVEEFQSLGHEVILYVPEKFTLQHDYNVPVQYLPGEGVSYTGLKGLRKIFGSVRKELNRQRWYSDMFKRAEHSEFDAIIIPTSTYRYLRALNFNVLRKSPVPVIFIVHGLNPKEVASFFKEVKKLRDYPNIRVAVLTFADSIFGRTFPNVDCIRPPVYTARDLDYNPTIKKQGTLKLGFFGQYRREKNLDQFLDTFLSCRFSEPVELTIQGATVHPDDAADFERISEKYSDYRHITFWHRGLIGLEWQEAIAGLDGLIMPYAAERYRYHWSAMLFTAIGYYKPVVASSSINPEVLNEYNFGTTFPSSDCPTLQVALEQFVNSYRQNADLYEQELIRANSAFSAAVFVSRLIGFGGNRG